MPIPNRGYPSSVRMRCASAAPMKVLVLHPGLVGNPGMVVEEYDDSHEDLVDADPCRQVCGQVRETTLPGTDFRPCPAPHCRWYPMTVCRPRAPKVGTGLARRLARRPPSDVLCADPPLVRLLSSYGAAYRRPVSVGQRAHPASHAIGYHRH